LYSTLSNEFSLDNDCDDSDDVESSFNVYVEGKYQFERYLEGFSYLAISNLF